MSFYQSQATKSVGGWEVLSGYPVKKGYFKMSTHARCKFLYKSGPAVEAGYIQYIK